MRRKEDGVGVGGVEEKGVLVEVCENGGGRGGIVRGGIGIRWECE